MSIIIYIDTHGNTWYTRGKSTHQPTYIPTPTTMGMGMGKPSDTHGYTHATPYLPDNRSLGPQASGAEQT